MDAEPRAPIDAAALQDAVAAGVLDAEQALRLGEFLAARARQDRVRQELVRHDLVTPVVPPASTSAHNLGADPDDEHFRLITGFNDVFVVIAIALSVAAIIALTGASYFAAPLVAAAAWGLSILFARRRRMALPSIVLAAVFVAAVAMAAAPVGGLLGRVIDSGRRPLQLAVSLAAGAAGALVHFRAFRVPIAIALAAGMVLGAVWTVLAIVLHGGAASGAMLSLFGLVVFALAMRYDVSDPARRTLRADIAFWLHLMAAPLLVHGAMLALYPDLSFNVIARGSNQSLGLFWALVGLCLLVGLAIDRRAMIVATLVYAMAALSALFRGAFDASWAATLGLVVMALALLSLSVWWRPIRAALLQTFPTTLRRLLPPAETTPAGDTLR